MSKDTGGPAFPFPVLHGKDAPTGMTLRDYFAAQALTGCQIWDSVLNGKHAVFVNGIDELAKVSYKIADAMLKAREE